MTLNFSAIAKGYSCDVVADFLDTKGIENYIVEIGGEIVAKGKNEKGKKEKGKKQEENMKKLQLIRSG